MNEDDCNANNTLFKNKLSLVFSYYQLFRISFVTAATVQEESFTQKVLSNLHNIKEKIFFFNQCKYFLDYTSIDESIFLVVSQTPSGFQAIK